MIGFPCRPKEDLETESLSTLTESEFHTTGHDMGNRALSSRKLMKNSLHQNKYKATSLTYFIPTCLINKRRLNTIWNLWKTRIT